MASGPDTYTHGHQDAVLRSHRWRTAENSAAYLVPSLRPGQRLLDVGCGPGTLTADLARLVSPGEVVGVDLSETVINEARRRAGANDARNVSYIVGDFREASIERGSFDVVHAHQVLQHVSDPIGALVSMRELANPEGIVAVRDSDYSAFTWAPRNELLDRWREIYLAVTRKNNAEPDAGRFLLEWAHAAGLRDAIYTSSTWTFSTADQRAWWADLWAERCVASSFADQAVEYEVASTDEMRSIADGWREWATNESAVFIVVHGEILARRA